MAQFSKPTFRGLLVPDDRVSVANISAADSSYSQAGPKPGIPAPQADTDLNLEASGTQSADKQLRIATQRGGHPGRGNASARWKNEADSAESWRGWIAPNTITGFKTLDVGNPLASSGTQAALDPTSVRLENGTVAFAWHQKNLTGIDTTYRVRFNTMTAGGVIGTPLTIYTTGDTITQGLHPSLVVMPGGRLMLFHYLEDLTQETVQIQAYYSDDDGANWTLATSACLPEGLDVSGSPGSGASGYDLDTRPAAKMRVAYSGGQMLMLICFRANDTTGGSYQDGFFQYASSDLGFNWDHVETWGNTITGTQADIVPAANGFNVFFLSLIGSDEYVKRRNLASAFIPLSTSSDLSGPGVLGQGSWDPGLFAGRTWTDGEVASILGEDGLLYVMARGRATAGAYSGNDCCDIRICMDRSGGADLVNGYENMGQGTEADTIASGDVGTIYFGENTPDFPRYFGLCAAQGRLILLHCHSASTSTRDNSLAVSTLGGYSTVTLGNYESGGSIPRRVCWDHMYLPFEEPNNFAGWTRVSGGTTSGNVTSGYLSISTGTGRREYHKTPPGTVAEGMICHFGVQHVSQTGAVNNYVFCRLTLADGSDSYAANINIRSGTIVVTDNNGGGILGSLTINCQDPGVEVLAFFKSNKLTVYACPLDQSSNKQWQQVISNVSVSDGGTGSCEVRFGHTAVSVAESKWHWLNYVSDEYAGGTPYGGGFVNPDNLHGAPVSSLVKTYIDDGVYIRGVDGPTKPGDSWNIDTRYEYPISNLLTASEPSPAKGWRSTDESAQTIAFSFSGVNRYSELGLYLDGINLRTATLAGYNGSAWVTLASVDSATGQTTLAYSQGGTTMGVNAAATTAPGRYFELNELVGGSVRVNPSSGPDFTQKITQSGAGVWTEAAGHVRANVEMDASPLVLATTGTLDIWSPRIFIAMHNVPSVYKKFRLVIDASQNTADGFYKIGQMVLGPLSLFSQDYSWGRSMSTTPGTELVTYRDGSRSSFKRSSNRRAVSFGWGEGVDVTGIQGTTPTADYLLATSTAGALPIGYRGDVPSLLNQLNAHTAGSNVPVVYCPNIAAGSSGQDVKTIQGLSNIYGRIVSGISTDSIVGEEDDGTAVVVVLISNVQIEEEL